MRTTRALGAIALGLALVLTACGDGPDTGPDDSSAQPSRTEHNESDVAFATDMIQHHAQALVMVDLTMERPLDPQVQALADDIRAAQAPEIETMSDWLQEWGEEIPETVRDHANAHGGHGTGGGAHADMPGMMSDDDMTALAEATDGQFQAIWLRMMIEHHEGAVAMAQAEQEQGVFKPAVALAGRVVSSQTREIESMHDLLD